VTLHRVALYAVSGLLIVDMMMIPQVFVDYGWSWNRDHKRSPRYLHVLASMGVLTILAAIGFYVTL
jgi:hypothetical protein